MTEWAARVLPCGRCGQCAVENLVCRNCTARHAILDYDLVVECLEWNELCRMVAAGTFNWRQPQEHRLEDVCKMNRTESKKKGGKGGKHGC